MPRYPRLFLPDIPLHVVQRGHNKKPVFGEPADYRYYLDNLIEKKNELGIRVFGYCLMTNHVHLIVMPGKQVENISRLMRVLAARQTRRVNKRESRSGTLWEGRFKASLVDSDAYLLACYRYVDLNPVRAGIAETPEGSEFTSLRARLNEAAAGARKNRRHARPLLPFADGCATEALPIRKQDYLMLVDIAGRVSRHGKAGRISPGLQPILERLGLSQQEWLASATRFKRAIRSGDLLAAKSA